jgi:multiple sugar transport system substrate-binding protein
MAAIIDTSSITRRSFLLRSAATAGALTGASALLGACGSSSSTGSSGKTTLTVMYNTSETDPKYFPDFEKANNCTIKLLQYDATKLSALLAAGTPPDFLRLNGATDVPNLAGRGLLTDLTSRFASSTVYKTNDLEPADAIFQWNGHQSGAGPRYGILKDWSLDAEVWINTKIFEDAGVPLPSTTKPLTYAELLELGKRLTKRDSSGKIQIYGLDTAWEFQFTYNQIVHNLAQTSTSLFSADLKTADFTQPEVLKLLQWYVDWAQAKVGPSPLTDPNDTGFTLFPANRLAMMQFGYWFGGAAIAPDTNGLQSHVQLLPTPQWGPERKVALFAGTGAVIPNGSKNKDLAFKFMEYFTSGTLGTARVKSGGGLPALKSQFALLPTALPYQKQALDVVNSELPYQTSLTYSPFVTSGAVGSALLQYLTPVIKGQGSLAQAAQQLTAAVNLLLQQGASQVG